MSKSKLFVPFMLRFSLINDQHVEVMNLLDKLIKSDKRSKNQVVMDALEYYFQREINGQESEQNFVDIETFESRIAKEREKLRAEIYQDIIGFLAGSALSGGIKNVTINPMKHETENSKEMRLLSVWMVLVKSRLMIRSMNCTREKPLLCLQNILMRF